MTIIEMSFTYKKIHLFLISYLVIIILISSYIMKDTIPENYHTYNDLWTEPPDIRMTPRSDLWFLNKEYPINEGNPSEVAKIIRLKLNDNKIDIIDEVFVDMALDLNHLALFVCVSDNSTYITNKILSEINHKENISIFFIKSPAPRVLIDEWKKIISNELPRYGVTLIGVSTTINGTIQLGVDDIGDENINKILTILKDKVPPGILEISIREYITPE